MNQVPPPPRLPGALAKTAPLAVGIPLVPDLPPPPAASAPRQPGPPGLRQFAASLGAAPLPLDPRSQLQSMLAEAPGSEIPVTSVEEAAKEFAGILFGYMFSEMRPKSDEGGLLGGGDSELFMDFFDRAMGRHFVDRAGSGIVDALLEQLTRQDQG